VFLALFQALLLSVFGLGAIRGERRTVEENLRESAEDFLHQYVVASATHGLRELADQVFLEAYGPQAGDWRARGIGGGLFTDAFALAADGSIRSAGGRVILLTREAADGMDAMARKQAAGLVSRFGRGLVEEQEKLRLDLEFAERFPFARDELGGSLALLFADSFRLAGAVPGVPTLLRMRWIGVLNRIGAYVAPTETDRFLARVDKAGAGRDGYAAGVREQGRRERVVRALEAESGRFAPSGPPTLHRNVMADKRVGFYVRRVGALPATQVLAVDPTRLGEFLDGIATAASRRAAAEGLEPRIVVGSAEHGDVWVGLKALPGFVATTRISPETVRERAGGRERFYWYIIAFSVAGILAGGFWTARTVMRQVRLAKLKSGFVSTVSHELKTPLTSIRMFAEMLSSGKVTDDAERQECLEVITQETERLSRLIQQVLDFGRLQSRQRRFDWRVASLAHLVDRETARFRRASGLDEERFEVHIAVNLPPVHHDPDAFSEVLANLLSNALKYSPQDDKHIVLTLGPSQGRVVLTVEDNGPGVAPRERRHIFEQFYRADDLLTRSIEGTGLGLSIARGIVRAHGGRIFVEDSSLGGSRFVVILPAVSRKRATAKRAPAETI